MTEDGFVNHSRRIKELERRCEVAERAVVDSIHDFQDLKKRFDAHEMRHAREIEALSEMLRKHEPSPSRDGEK